jgi:hypothetical protein
MVALGEVHFPRRLIAELLKLGLSEWTKTPLLWEEGLVLALKMCEEVGR